MKLKRFVSAVLSAALFVTSLNSSFADTTADCGNIVENDGVVSGVGLDVGVESEIVSLAASSNTVAYPVEGGNIYINSEGYVVGADESVIYADIPESVNGITVVGIDYSAFSGGFENSNLKGVTIPATVVDINSIAFCDDYNLEYINVDSNNEDYMSIDGVLYSIYNGQLDDLIQYPYGKECDNYIIPGIVSFTDNLFQGDFNYLKTKKFTFLGMDTEITGMAWVSIYEYEPITVYCYRGSMVDLNISEARKEFDALAIKVEYLGSENTTDETLSETTTVTETLTETTTYLEPVTSKSLPRLDDLALFNSKGEIYNVDVRLLGEKDVPYKLPENNVGIVGCDNFYFLADNGDIYGISDDNIYVKRNYINAKKFIFGDHNGNIYLYLSRNGHIYWCDDNIVYPFDDAEGKLIVDYDLNDSYEKIILYNDNTVVYKYDDFQLILSENKKIKSVYMGYGACYYLTEDGNLYEYNTSSNNLTKAVLEDVSEISGSEVCSIDTGVNSAEDTICYTLLALKNDGSVWTKGNNDSGQLGNNSTVSSESFVMCENLDNVISISEWYGTSYALKADGSLYYWGISNIPHFNFDNCVRNLTPVKIQGFNALGNEVITTQTTTNATTTTEDTTQPATTQTTTKASTTIENQTEATTKAVEATTETTTAAVSHSSGGGGSSRKETATTATTTTEATTEAVSEEYTEVTTEAIISKEVRVTIGSRSVKIGEKAYDIDTAPYIQTGSSSTLVPLRFVTLAICGGDLSKADSSNIISWDATTKTATINADGKVIQFTAGSEVMLIDGKAITMYNGVKAEIKDSRMFIPFRALGEALGVDVDWEADTKTAVYTVK